MQRSRSIAAIFSFALGAICAAAVLPPSAAATLIGDLVFGDVYAPGSTEVNLFSLVSTTDPVSATVNDPGIEFSNTSGDLTYFADFRAFDLTFGYDFSASFREQTAGFRWEFTSLEWAGYVGGIDAVQVIAESFDGDLAISFTSDSVTIYTSPFSNPAPDEEGGERSATLKFHVSQAVPEPGTLLLLGSGLVGMAGYQRRKVSRSAGKLPHGSG